jgi:hypothetical protein
LDKLRREKLSATRSGLPPGLLLLLLVEIRIDDIFLPNRQTHHHQQQQLRNGRRCL